tara:strand:+ start:537 stop:1337 length:801 start_codon:yes stop_codon:yes gene_type:complete
LQIDIPNNIINKISDRCLRCYKEQYWYGENFLFDYIDYYDLEDKKILEIGCAEAGLLKFYQSKGAKCSGLELSNERYSNAILLDQNNSIDLFQADICNPNSYKEKIIDNYDIIIIRDVIEHIENKKIALRNMYGLLKEGGRIFMSFPPKYCAYAGHQQTAPQILAKLPYLYLLPDILYKFYLGILGCNRKKINYLLETKKKRVSIKNIKKIIIDIGFKIEKESHWFIRPAYKFRFGIPKIINPLSFMPFFNEIFSNGVLFLLVKKS